MTPPELPDSEDRRLHEELDRILASLDRMTVSAREISEALSQAPGLAEAILRAANSARMGLRHRVEDLSHAVALLGSDEVRRIVGGAARGRE